MKATGNPNVLYMHCLPSFHDFETKLAKEWQEKGVDISFEKVLEDVKQRDYQDTHREAAPLKQADDAVLLDTSELNFEQSLDAMKQIIASKV